MIAGEIAHRSARSINAYTFLQSGAGAKKRTAQNKARETVSPLDFGATGDGATDDTAALAAALATGKLVYLDPTKTYAFGSQLTPPSNGGFVGFGKLREPRKIGETHRVKRGTRGEGEFSEPASLLKETRAERHTRFALAPSGTKAGVTLQ